MNYFVTGATGFIGGHVAQQLLAAGHDVCTLARTSPQVRKLEELGYTAYLGDITDKYSMRPAMEGADGVFHIASWNRLDARDRHLAEQINVQGTRNVLELMKELRIPRGVYTSNICVFSDTRGRVVDETYRYYGPHRNEYDRTRWIAHYEVAEPMMREGLPLVIVMPGVVYGPGDTSALHDAFVHYLKHELPVVPRDTAFCWAHVDDVARAHLLAMEKGRPGETYIIAGPRHTLVEVFEIAEKVTGVKAPHWHPGPGIMRLLAGMMQVVSKVTHLPEDYQPESPTLLPGVTYIASDQKARNELGWSPRSLEEGLRETLWFEKQQLEQEASLR
ncbi:MAG: NAD-dependent epimerase/dehydratase family protein [Chloroherpetonaceae bacterium]|nr:NAD-dependent epimerase/dehydratase family protein [Chthonomonadaceae bacterium]MDW8207743.1 NAD-dependent epimerase/dehydratase family protein [Chloroherpetonaceae bacterium]